jgi:hypothetical protein
VCVLLVMVYVFMSGKMVRCVCANSSTRALAMP